jgi:hypothetical protein
MDIWIVVNLGRAQDLIWRILSLLSNGVSSSFHNFVHSHVQLLIALVCGELISMVDFGLGFVIIRAWHSLD